MVARILRVGDFSPSKTHHHLAPHFSSRPSVGSPGTGVDGLAPTRHQACKGQSHWAGAWLREKVISPRRPRDRLAGAILPAVSPRGGGGRSPEGWHAGGAQVREWICVLGSLLGCGRDMVTCKSRPMPLRSCCLLGLEMFKQPCGSIAG